MNFEINKCTLIAALELSLDKSIDVYTKEFFEPHEFSPAFKRRMKKILWDADHPVIAYTKKIAKRVAVILVLLLTLLTTTVMSVDALRERFFKFIEEKFPEFSIISYVSESGAPLPTFEEKYPQYIPEGMGLIESDHEGQLFLYFQDSQGNDLLYRQLPIASGKTGINTEGVELEPIKIKGYEGYYFSNIGYYSIIWDDGVYQYYVSSNLSKDVLLLVANSL